MSNYDENATILDNELDAMQSWATIYTPEYAARDLKAHLLGQLMAATSPDEFAEMVERAAEFAGRPAKW